MYHVSADILGENFREGGGGLPVAPLGSATDNAFRFLIAASSMKPEIRLHATSLVPSAWANRISIKLNTSAPDRLFVRVCVV